MRLRRGCVKVVTLRREGSVGIVDPLDRAMPMIDLRSDTVTRPTAEMRAAMAGADVGDDVYGEDPTVNVLESRTAALLGMEQAVFMPTGTMTNQVGIRVHTEPGDLVMMDAEAHAILNEGGAAAAIAGVTTKQLQGAHGVFTGEDVLAALEPPHRFNPVQLRPTPRLVCVENTHNAGGGVVWSMDEIRDVTDAARGNGLALHLDGARLWHASAASGVPVSSFAEPFDTVSVCFSKGLGAPVGSALAGTAGLMRRARRFKQQLGGGFRQAGILAAAALHALDHHRERLAEDVEHARLFAEGIASIEAIRVDLGRVQSNIVRFEVTAISASDFADRCHEAGVHMLPNGELEMRAVTHLDVSREDVVRALEVIGRVVASQGAGAWAV